MQPVLLQKSYSLDEFARLNDIAFPSAVAAAEPVSEAQTALADQPTLLRSSGERHE